jgi:hypothetical protein
VEVPAVGFDPFFGRVNVDVRDRNVRGPLYADLVARQFVVQVNHTAKTICVAGVIDNIGYASARGPFQVALGITYTPKGVTTSSQSTFTIDEVPVGPGFRTPCVTKPLIYRNEDAGAVYRLELLVDLNNDINELSGGNNFTWADVWWVKPSAIPKLGGMLEIDTSPNRGASSRK